MTQTRKIDKSKNLVNVIHPYREKGRTWVYDDADVPVYAEAFVCGSSELIDMLVGEECNHFTDTISASPLPSPTVVLDNIDKLVASEDPKSQFVMQGYYQMRGTEHRNWFCGHLLDYFEGYPETIYVVINNLKQ